MKVIIRLANRRNSPHETLHEQEFNLSDVSTEDSNLWQDHLLRIGIRFGSQHSPRTGQPWYFVGCRFPEFFVNGQPYSVEFPVGDVKVRQSDEFGSCIPSERGWINDGCGDETSSPLNQLNRLIECTTQRGFRKSPFGCFFGELRRPE
jgi:hypothetical protein